MAELQAGWVEWRDLPLQELIELAKRVQPGYDAVHELIHDAVSGGVTTPSISTGFYLQGEIRDVLNCAQEPSLAETGHVECQNRRIVSD